MTPLEERIAEAMRRDFLGWQLDHGYPEESVSLILGELARAVVAVLPTADVSDEAIRNVLLDWVTTVEAAEMLPVVRHLLDAQAAAHAAEVEALRAENERLKTELARGVVEMARLVRDRDRAVREALEKVLTACAWELHDGTTSDYEAGQRRAKDDLARIVRGLIPEPDLGVWTQEQVDSINERAARRAEALAPLIEGDTDD